MKIKRKKIECYYSKKRQSKPQGLQVSNRPVHTTDSGINELPMNKESKGLWLGQAKFK